MNVRQSVLDIRIFEDQKGLAAAAAAHAAESIKCAIAERSRARIIAATGASQFEFLDALTQYPDIDWTSVEMFHLDEYIGIPETHPASFRRYLLERLILKTGLLRYHLLDAESESDDVLRRIGNALLSAPIDIAFVGIGENGHLAFNDPPADFETEEPYLVVELDEACRQQQVGEGWFESLNDVPRKAISMSIRQIMKATEIICIAPELRKAIAVKQCFEGPVSNMAPASILRTHPNTTVYLDTNSASMLSSPLKVSLD